MRSPAPRWCAVLVGLCLAGAARADVTVETALGHGGRWVRECVTPVSVTLHNDGTAPAAVRLTLAKSQMLGSPPVRHERAVFLGPGATRREWFVVPSPDPYAASLSLSLLTDPEVPIHHRGETATRGRMTIDVQGPQPLADATLPSAGRVVGVLGDDRNVLPALLPNASRKELIDVSGDLAVVTATAIDGDALVLAPFSLEGFDALVLVDPDAGALSDPAALSGVLDWVALGGLLVVSPGSHAGALGATPIAPYLPATSGAPAQRDVGPVVALLATEADEETEHAPNRFDGAWLTLTDTAHGGLYADRDLGAGRIRLLAFDVRAALRSCSDPGHYAGVAAIVAGRQEPLRDLELAEKIGQLRFGMGTDVEKSVSNVLRRDAFEAPNLIVILASLALYVLVVGPLDWIVLRRLGKQRLTTFTFGGAVLIFTAVAYGASFLVFASGAVVNRMAFVDLVDAGRDGRQLVRVTDLVGYYSPRGADKAFSYALPTVVEGAALPGGGTSEVGTAQPLVAAGTDPLSPEILLQVAFRSQRVVRTVMAGPTGRTIETEWLPAEGTGRARLRLVNALPTALERVDVLLPDGRGAYRFGAVPAGGEAVAEHTSNVSGALGGAWVSGGLLVDRGFEPLEVAHFQAFLSRTSAYGFDGRSPRDDLPQPVGLDRQALLARTGIGRGDALRHGRALLLAFAREAPVPLPSAADDGHTYVLLRKEIELP